MTFTEATSYKHYVSVEIIEQAAYPRVMFATGVPIDYSEVEPGVEYNLGARAEKVRAEMHAG